MGDLYIPPEGEQEVVARERDLLDDEKGDFDFEPTEDEESNELYIVNLSLLNILPWPAILLARSKSDSAHARSRSAVTSRHEFIRERK